MADETVDISDVSDAMVASTRARVLAEALGFPRATQWEIATAVSEAASNIAKHAGRGSIHLHTVAGERPFFEFEAIDSGGGIPDIELALHDGISEGRRLDPDATPFPRRGLGVGLGAIRRLMDDLEIRSTSGQTWIHARKSLRR